MVLADNRACGKPMTASRRAFLGLTAAGAVIAVGAQGPAIKGGPAHDGLRSLTGGTQPISAAEHGARLAKVQSLMQQRRTAALLVESGSTLEYFTGVRWRRSERTTAALIPASGQVVVVTPYFEEPSIRETLRVPADLRPWREDESPFELIAGPCLAGLGLQSRSRWRRRRGSSSSSRSHAPRRRAPRSCPQTSSCVAAG